MADRVETEAERLYGLPLEAFVRERDAAAKALRAEQERDAAKAVAGLAKPSAGAWAVNAIAREQPDLRDELLAAGDAVRDAQEAAVSGQGAKALRDATSRQRRAIDAVLAAAAELEPGGKPLGRPALDRLRQTLQAAAGDDTVRTAIAQGRLVRDAEGGGAWPFGGDEDGDGEPAATRKPRRAAGPKRDAAAGEDQRKREREEREARERRKALEAELAEARAERRARDRELARAERAAERAANRLDEAQAALDAAREEAEEAHSELDAAREAADTARDVAARIEEQLD